MKDRPILFSAPMVLALLDWRKTQTRRLASSKPTLRIAVGDRLWVREAFAKVGDEPDDVHACPDMRIHAYYRADMVDPERQRWRNPIFMPRWASRLTLTVTDTRTQPLQSITEADARAEGIERVQLYAGSDHHSGPDGRTFAFAASAYANLWNTLHTKPGERWEDNPDVIALTFTVEHRNIDG